MTSENKERAVHELLNLVDDLFPRDRTDEIRSLNQAGEPAVALEILVDNIIDLDLPVSPEFRDAALRLAAEMKLLGTANRWRYLEDPDFGRD